MNRIDERFAKVKADGRKALITFLTVGDPNLEVSEKAIYLSLIHISEPTRRTPISYAVFCLKKKRHKKKKKRD